MDLLDIKDHESLDLGVKVSDFIEDEQWNAHKLHTFLRSPTLVQKILGIPIPLTDINDSFCWGLSSSGSFTTKSATWLAQGIEQEEPPWPFKGIWKLDIVPKIKIFLWQMCHNALPLRGTLFRCGCQLDPQCPLCMTDIESIEHLFQDGPQIQTIWELVQQHWWIPSHSTSNNSSPWLTKLETFLTTYDRQTLQRIAFLLWSIWRMRNEVICSCPAY